MVISKKFWIGFQLVVMGILLSTLLIVDASSRAWVVEGQSVEDHERDFLSQCPDSYERGICRANDNLDAEVSDNLNTNTLVANQHPNSVLRFEEDDSSGSENDALFIFLIILLLGGAAFIYGLVYFKPEVFGQTSRVRKEVRSDEEERDPSPGPKPTPETFASPILPTNPYSPTHFSRPHNPALSPLAPAPTSHSGDSDYLSNLSEYLSKSSDYLPQSLDHPRPHTHRFPSKKPAAARTEQSGSDFASRVQSTVTLSHENSQPFRPKSGSGQHGKNPYDNSIFDSFSGGSSAPKTKPTRPRITGPTNSWTCPNCQRSWGMERPFCFECGTKR